MKDEKDIKGNKGSTTNKVKKLQKQYNKILVDLFDQFAAESIEEALDQNDGSFGENLQSIVQCALDCLKGKVMQELGVSGDAGNDAGGAVDAIMGGVGLGGLSLGDGMGSMDSENSSEDEEDESDENEESEESESGEEDEEKEDEEKDEDEDDEDDDKIEEKAPTGQKMERVVRYNESDESIVRDKGISSSRRGDQVSLTEAYMSMYKESTESKEDVTKIQPGNRKDCSKSGTRFCEVGCKYKDNCDDVNSDGDTKDT